MTRIRPVLTRLLMVLTSLTAASLTAAPAAAASPRGATDRSAKPEDPLFAAPRVAFDCSSPHAVISLAPGDADVLADDTTGGENNLTGYACRSWSENGPEHVYELTVTEDLVFWAGLRDLGEGEDAIDLDLFLLDACDTDSCLVGANLELSLPLTAGTYWLVVDGFSYPEPQAGPYSLHYECRWPGVPPAVCEPGYATELACSPEVIQETGDLAGTVNQVQTYDCSPFITRGGEIWYLVTVPGFSQLNVTVTDLHPDLDISLWIFDGCGPDAACLAFADDKTAGQGETVAWSNTDYGGVPVLVGFDCSTPAAAGSGSFAADFVCDALVDAEKTSLGSLRAIYR